MGGGGDWRKSSKTERRFLARANYDPTWRVKGNPICITRRASYRHESTISPLHASFFASIVLLFSSSFTFFPRPP